MISVEGKEEAIHITIPREDLEPSQVEAILRPLRFAGLVAGSHMSKEEAIQLGEDSKADWWEKNQARFFPSTGE